MLCQNASLDYERAIGLLATKPNDLKKVWQDVDAIMLVILGRFLMQYASKVGCQNAKPH
jgi:hypothetical protein